MLQIGASLGAE